MTTYLAVAVLDQLDRAQRDIDGRTASGCDGRCLGCGRLLPCPARVAAGAVFVRYGRLPHRIPGLALRGFR